MSLLGLAQFALGAGDTYNKEKERLDVKAYDRGRQKVIDDRADQAERRTQEAWNIEKPEAELKLEATKRLATSAKDADLYTKVNNQVLHLESLGDSLGAVDTIVTGTNSHSAVPFKMDVVRNEAGKAVAFQNDDGNTYYKTGLYDKETGELISETDMTMDELKNSYTQLQDGTARAAAAAEIQRKRQEKLDDAEIEVASFKDKEAVKQGYTVTNKELDNKIKLGQMGVQYDLDVGKLNIGQQHAIEKLGIGQQYALDRIGAQATNAQTLAQLQSDLRSGLIDQQTYNAIQKDLANAGISQGQTPIINQGKGSVSGVVKVVSAGAGWTKMQLSDGSIVTARGNRNFRNNNPGNIEYGSFAKGQGAVGGDGRFAVFSSYESGLRAMEALIFTGSSYRNKTLTSAIARYAPPSENNTRSYASNVLRAVGGKNKVMSQYTAAERRAIVNAMVAVEGRNNATYTSTGGVKVSFGAKLQPKTTAARKTAAGQTKPVTVNDYHANVDKGFKAAVASGASYGIKKDATSTVQFTQAAAIVKAFPKAKSQAEFSSLYANAVNTVIKAIPAAKLKKLSNDQKRSIGNALILQMAGASSASDLKTTIYNLNPSLRAGSTSNLAKVANKPKPASRYQAAKDRNASQQTTAANAPAAKPASAATRNLNNANSAIDWN